MFNLTVAYVNQAEREREVESDLRRRQILSPPDTTIASNEPVAETARTFQGSRQAPIRARAVGR